MEKLEGGLVCGGTVERGGSEEGDRIGWFGDLTGQDVTAWEDESRDCGKEEGGLAPVRIGHPGWYLELVCLKTIRLEKFCKITYGRCGGCGDFRARRLRL